MNKTKKNFVHSPSNSIAANERHTMDVILNILAGLGPILLFFGAFAVKATYEEKEYQAEVQEAKAKREKQLVSFYKMQILQEQYVHNQREIRRIKNQQARCM